MDYVNDQQPFDDSDPSETTPETKAHPDLYKKTIRGGFWLITERVVQQVLSFARLLVLAKLLPPREFGVLGIAMLLLQLFETFTQTGFYTALIQRKEEDIHPYLPTVWTVGLIRGFVLFAIFIIAAPMTIPFFDGDGSFRPGDFTRPLELTQSLLDQDNPVSVYVLDAMPEATRRQVAEIAELSLSQAEARERLSAAFNLLVQKDVFYNPEVFSAVDLPAYAREMISTVSPQTKARANRMLLQQVWPNELQHTVLNRWELTWIIRAVGLILILRALGNPGVVYFAKTLQFEKNFVLHVGATVVSVVSTVILALVLHSVWALVGGLLLSGAAGLVMSYLFYPWRPRFEVDREKLHQMWRFGRWITGQSWLDLALTMGDSILVGRLLGASSLGLYQMSTRLSALPINEVTAVIARATLPAFSRIQSDIERMRDAVLKSMDIVSAIVMPAVGAIILFADDIVLLFMQEAWTPMISTLRILAITGFFRTVPVSSIFQSLGKPAYLTVLTVGRIALIAVSFYPMVRNYGLDGMAWVISLSGVIMLIPGYVILRHSLKCPIRVFVARQAAQAIGTVSMMAVGFAVKHWLWTETGYVRLLTLGIVSLAVYASVCLALTPVFKAKWLSFLIERWHQVRRFAGRKVKTAVNGGLLK